MAHVKYILTADDYGPSEFINQGVRKMVEQGRVNCTQVLANFDKDKLINRLVKLGEVTKKAPNFNQCSVGAHLTLTSGPPLHGSDNPGATWGPMVKNGQFEDFSNFYFWFVDDDRLDFRDTIEQEFQLQIEQLRTAVKEANKQLGKDLLNFNSVSNHHNIFTTKKELFDIYHKVAVNNGLSMRSPNAIPAKVARRYLKIGLRLKAHRLRPVDVDDMMTSYRSFLANQYTGEKDISFKTTKYVDIEYYRQLGSVVNGRMNKRGMMADLEDDLYSMIDRAQEHDKKTVEFVFHLATNDVNYDKAMNKKLVEGYRGIEPKYFNNRLMEINVLESLAPGTIIFSEAVQGDWSKCEIQTFKANKKYLKVLRRNANSDLNKIPV